MLAVRRTIQFQIIIQYQISIYHRIQTMNRWQILLLPFLIVLAYCDNETVLCGGNRFRHNAKYSYGRQTDIVYAFENMTAGGIEVDQLKYQQEIFRTYELKTNKITTQVILNKQTDHVEGTNHLNFTGATVRIRYQFVWNKTQLSEKLNGTGEGEVVIDPISFVKSLDINKDKQTLEWNFISAHPITITNSLTLQKISPYKQLDYQVINEMLNNRKDNKTTLKDQLVKALNKNYQETLAYVIHQYNDTHPEPTELFYSYADQHGEIDFHYNNTMLDLKLGDGLDLLLSTSIIDNAYFDCGDKVPFQPEQVRTYGDQQQFISNNFFKSNLRYALEQQKFLDISMSEQNWQSHGFQFYMGDLHQVIPKTQNISALQPLKGSCKALYDQKHFIFEKMAADSYDVQINYTCQLTYKNQKILGIDLLAQYIIEVQVQMSQLNFQIAYIDGTPIFNEVEGYQIENYKLAKYMVGQTLQSAIGSSVIGSGFKITPRITPKRVVRNEYLLIYDASAISKISQVQNMQLGPI